MTLDPKQVSDEVTRLRSLGGEEELTRAAELERELEEQQERGTDDTTVSTEGARDPSMEAAPEPTPSADEETAPPAEWGGTGTGTEPQETG